MAAVYHTVRNVTVGTDGNSDHLLKIINLFRLADQVRDDADIRRCLQPHDPANFPSGSVSVSASVVFENVSRSSFPVIHSPAFCNWCEVRHREHDFFSTALMSPLAVCQTEFAVPRRLLRHYYVIISSTSSHTTNALHATITRLWFHDGAAAGNSLLQEQDHVDYVPCLW